MLTQKKILFKVFTLKSFIINLCFIYNYLTNITIKNMLEKFQLMERLQEISIKIDKNVENIIF